MQKNWIPFKNAVLRLCLATALTFSSQTGAVHAQTEQERVELEQIFRKATEERDAGRYPAAIELYNTILARQPELHRARLELAVAHYKNRSFAEARQQAQQVLDDLKTPEQVRIAILAFLAQMSADETKGVGASDWRFPLGLGFLYDSNVTAGPDTDVLNIVNVDPASLAESDWARVASLAMNHTYQSATSLPIGAGGASFLWQTGISLYDRDYADMDDYDLRVLSLRMGPGLVGNDRGFRANMAFQGDIIVFGGEKLANFINMLPSVTWNVRPDTEVTLDGVVSVRDYSRPIDRGRDSTFLAPRLTIGYSFLNGKASVLAGGAWFLENAEESRRGNEGTEFFIGASWTFLENSTVYARLGQKDIDFSDVEPVFVLKREERERQELLGARHVFARGNAGEWALNLQASFLQNDSNIAIYDYDREQYSTNIEARF